MIKLSYEIDNDFGGYNISIEYPEGDIYDDINTFIKVLLAATYSPTTIKAGLENGLREFIDAFDLKDKKED